MAPGRRPISSIGQIAHRLERPISRIEYVLKTRDIKPIALAGNARVFDEDAVERIAAALRHIDTLNRRREGGER
jgi:hypothetical protein